MGGAVFLVIFVIICISVTGFKIYKAIQEVELKRAAKIYLQKKAIEVSSEDKENIENLLR